MGVVMDVMLRYRLLRLDHLMRRYGWSLAVCFTPNDKHDGRSNSGSGGYQRSNDRRIQRRCPFRANGKIG